MRPELMFEICLLFILAVLITINMLQTAASFQNSRSFSVLLRKITKFLTTLMHQ